MPAITITLEDTGVAYSLLTLLRAVDAALPGECRSLLLEADLDNAEDSLIQVGDASVGDTRCGYKLGPGASREYQSNGGPRNPTSPGVQLGVIYLRGSDDDLVVNCEVMI